MHLGGYDNVFLPFRLSILTPGRPLVKSNPSRLWRNVSHVQDTRKLIHNVESRYGAFLRTKIMLSFFFLPLIITCEIIKYLNCLCHYWSTFLLLVSNASLRVSGSTNSLVFCLFVCFVSRIEICLWLGFALRHWVAVKIECGPYYVG